MERRLGDTPRRQLRSFRARKQRPLRRRLRLAVVGQQAHGRQAERHRQRPLRLLFHKHLRQVHQVHLARVATRRHLYPGAVTEPRPR